MAVSIQIMLYLKRTVSKCEILTLLEILCDGRYVTDITKLFFQQKYLLFIVTDVILTNKLVLSHPNFVLLKNDTLDITN